MSIKYTTLKLTAWSLLIGQTLPAVAYDFCTFPLPTESCFGAASNTTSQVQIPSTTTPLFTYESHYDFSPLGVFKTSGPSAAFGAVELEVRALGMSSSSVLSQVNIGNLTSTSTALSSLASGKIGASIFHNALVGHSFAFGISKAALYDVLTIEAPFHVESFVLNVSLNITGSIFTSATSLPFSPFVEAGVKLSTSFMGKGSGATFVATNAGKYSENISTTLLVTRPAGESGATWYSTVNLYSYLEANTFVSKSPSVFIDFDHTAALAIDLPDYITYTSASGILLSSTVLENSTITLLIAGIFFFAPIIQRAKHAKQYI